MMNGMVNGHRRLFLLYWRKRVSRGGKRIVLEMRPGTVLRYTHRTPNTKNLFTLKTKVQKAIYFEPLSVFWYFFSLVEFRSFDMRFFFFLFSTDNVITYSINNYMAETHAESEIDRMRVEVRMRKPCGRRKAIYFRASPLILRIFYNGNFLFAALSDSSYIPAHSHGERLRAFLPLVYFLY